MGKGIRSKALRALLLGALAAGWIGTQGAYVPERAAASALQPVQLIAEQDFIMPGGTITYHLIYHADLEAAGAATASVRLPDGLTLVDPGAGTWDEASRTLSWDFADVEAGTAAAVRFRAETSGSAAMNDAYALSAEATLGAAIELGTPEVVVTVGTDTHQPFLQGYPDGTFRPEGALTRAETAAAIARIKGLRETGGGIAFEDVEPSHWAYRYIRQMSAEGYMVGYDGRFRPEDPITKGELVALMLRLRGISVVPLESSLAESIDDWSKFAVGTAETLGLVAADAVFAPGEPIERQLAAQWLSVGLHRGPLHDGDAAVEAHFPDVPPTHPYFRWIEEASSVAHESEDRGDFREYLIRYLPELTNSF